MAASFRRGSSMSPAAAGETPEKLDLAAPGEMAVASWVAANGEAAGATTDTLREARCLYLPIRSKDRVFGVAGLVMEQGDDDFGSFERNLLVALLDECRSGGGGSGAGEPSGRTSP